VETIIVVIFILGYLAITLEHSIKIDKLVPALLMMALVWACIALGLGDLNHWFDSDHHQLIDNFSQFAGPKNDFLKKKHIVPKGSQKRKA